VGEATRLMTKGRASLCLPEDQCLCQDLKFRTKARSSVGFAQHYPWE
jgi:hypothetical protein